MGVRRGVLGGAVLVAVGAPFLLQALSVANASAYLFVALGIAFLAAWYVGTRQYVYMVPAAVLIAFGLGLVVPTWLRSEEHTSELQSRENLVCRLLLEKKK